MAKDTYVVCLECGTVCGEGHGKEIFSHMVLCLKVELDSLERIREVAKRDWGERGRRVIHLIDAMEKTSDLSEQVEA